MNLTLRQLRAFVAVARTGSFTAAAESLFLTQSALSGLIKELEENLGLRLFDRTTRRIYLSTVGEDLLPKVRKILADIDALGHEVEHLKGLYYGQVKIAVSQQLAASLMSDVLADYQSIHQEIQIGVVDCAVERVVDHVLGGEADWGIGPERETKSEIEALKLFELPFYAALPMNHPLAKQKELSWLDLVGEKLVTLKGPFSERLAEQLPSQQERELLENSSKVNYMSTALSMVSAGMAMTVCMPYVNGQLKPLKLTMRKMVNPEVSRKFYIFQRKGASLSPAAENLKQYMIAKLEQGKFFDI